MGGDGHAGEGREREKRSRVSWENEIETIHGFIAFIFLLEFFLCCRERKTRKCGDVFFPFFLHSVQAHPTPFLFEIYDWLPRDRVTDRLGVGRERGDKEKQSSFFVWTYIFVNSERKDTSTQTIFVHSRPLSRGSWKDGKHRKNGDTGHSLVFPRSWTNHRVL